MPVNFASLPSRNGLISNSSPDGLLHRRTSRTTLAERLLDEGVQSRILPQQVLIIYNDVFRLTKANLDKILEEIHLAVETVSLTERTDENASVLSISLGSCHQSPNGLVYSVDYYGIPKPEVVLRHFVLHMVEAKRLNTTGDGQLIFYLPLPINPRDVADGMYKTFGENVGVASLRHSRTYVLSFPFAQSAL